MDINTPGNSHFKHFLTPQNFRKEYGQPKSITDQLAKYFKAHHFQVKTFNNGLVMQIEGLVTDTNNTFATNIETAKYYGNKIQFSPKKPSLPSNIAQPIQAVLGITDMVKLTSLSHPADTKVNDSGATAAGNPRKFLSRYHATSTKTQGNQGKGQTIGIITLSQVHPSEITHFWSVEKAPSSVNRLTVDNVNGSDINDLGDTESALDVEQAGTLAPKASVRVYTANPDDVGWVSAFATAFGENRASSLSLSWGLPENELQALDKFHLLTPLYATILNTLFAQGAMQGISIFAASGDSGAYAFPWNNSGSNDEQGIYATLPAGNPWVTSTGGTTIPYDEKLSDGNELSIKKERAWGGDEYFVAYRKDPDLFLDSLGNFALLQGGSGGGISALYSTPSYQKGVSGINTFNARQYLTKTGYPNTDLNLIKGIGSGRNYPDLAANADPQTGYDIYTAKGGWGSIGGTSVVAPQFAALTADMNSNRSQRMGFWNPQIYRLAQTNQSPFMPLDADADNGNLYYVGQPGKLYNQATGLGTVNFNKLAALFK